MITYEEALKKARGMKSRIETCVETPTAFIFKNEDDEESIGGEGICYIIKETGAAVDGMTFYDNYADFADEDCKEFDVK